MELLQIPEDRGYPTEYLLARIRGRHTYLLRDWDNIVFSQNPFEYLRTTRCGDLIARYSQEGVWKRQQIELQWVYYQMNKGLRDIFMPFFICSEIKTLIICFRYKVRRGNTAEVEKILPFSLLSGKIKEALKKDVDLPSVLEEFEEKFSFHADRLLRLKEIFLKNGLKGVEQTLTGEFLEHTISTGLYPVLKNFFISIIDFKNTITLYKYLRWNIKAEPLFIHGGSIRKSSLKKMIQPHKISEIAHLIFRLTGQRVEEPGRLNIENILLKGLTRQIKIMGRVSPDIGPILDYLWRCSLEAQNLSIILYGREVDRDVLKEELVYW